MIVALISQTTMANVPLAVYRLDSGAYDRVMQAGMVKINI